MAKKVVKKKAPPVQEVLAPEDNAVGYISFTIMENNEVDIDIDWNKSHHTSINNLANLLTLVNLGNFQYDILSMLTNQMEVSPEDKESLQLLIADWIRKIDIAKKTLNKKKDRPVILPSEVFGGLKRKNIDEGDM